MARRLLLCALHGRGIPVTLAAECDGATRSGFADLPVTAPSAWVSINGGIAMSSPGVRSRNVLERTSIRFAAALLAALASFVGGSNAALAGAPQHHMNIPALGRLHKEGIGYGWAPVVFTDQWDKK
jgi:hypothetical protein